MVSPHILEQLLEHQLTLDLATLGQHSEPGEDCLEVVASQHALDNIGPVQTVNTVGPENTSLNGNIT